VAWLDLADERTCHVIIGGTTGSGKTVTLHWLLYRLLRQNEPAALRLLALDPKRGELAPFAHVPHLLHPITSNPLEIARMLTWVAGELDRRAATGRRQPRLVVILEEVADVLKATPAAGDLLARVAQIGRGLGVHLVATTQQPGARSLGDALANFPARLLGRVASATLTYGAAGRARTMADQLLGRGDFLLITADGTTRLQTPLIDGRQYRLLPRVEQVATLDDELPTLAFFADLARDPRGGRGRRVLSQDNYAEIDAQLADGADPDDLRGRFHIGYDRARRIYDAYRGDQ
jgi:S-DNA-T family DNA segregation ATPase FtsK/SpoIIIE